mgnify:CR=1 FL=1
MVSNPLTAKPIQINWATLSTLNTETYEIPETIKEIQNKEIQIAGFIVPLELDEYIDEVKEFVLVPTPLDCIHIPPPPPNQMIYVRMKEAIPLDMDFRGVSINGILTIAKPEIQELLVSFELEGLSVKEAEITLHDPFYDILPSE